MEPHWTRFQRLGYVLICVVGFAVFMTWWGGFIRPHTDAAWEWLSASFGPVPSLVALLALAAAGMVWNIRSTP